MEHRKLTKLEWVALEFACLDHRPGNVPRKGHVDLYNKRSREKLLAIGYVRPLTDAEWNATYQNRRLWKKERVFHITEAGIAAVNSRPGWQLRWEDDPLPVLTWYQWHYGLIPVAEHNIGEVNRKADHKTFKEYDLIRDLTDSEAADLRRAGYKEYRIPRMFHITDRGLSAVKRYKEATQPK